jgi:hypothetical protein
VSEPITYEYLAPREASTYQQYFVKGRGLRAETLYRATVGPEPMSPDEVATIATFLLRLSTRRSNTPCAMQRSWKENATKIGRNPCPEPLAMIHTTGPFITGALAA